MTLVMAGFDSSQSQGKTKTDEKWPYGKPAIASARMGKKPAGARIVLLSGKVPAGIETMKVIRSPVSLPLF
jgi:hypothetical protein